VVGGDEQQIVLAHTCKKLRERHIELPERLIKPRNVVPVPKLLVEIY